MSLALLKPEEKAALIRYAQDHGAYADGWKSSLLKDWDRGGMSYDPHDEYCYLQRIRNRLGPKWLAELVLIEVVTYEAQVGWERCCWAGSEAEAIAVCESGAKLGNAMGFDGRTFGPSVQDIEHSAWLSRTPR